MTKAKFIREVRKPLSQLGPPAEQFTGHSFRIGAATTAAPARLEDSVIQALGRWSKCRLSAIHTNTLGVASPVHLTDCHPAMEVGGVVYAFYSKLAPG